MNTEIADEYRSFDERLSGLLSPFAPPTGLADRAIARLRPRRVIVNPFQIGINPFVARAAAVVAGLVIVGALGYVADQKLNPPKQIAVATSEVLYADGHADFSAVDSDGDPVADKRLAAKRRTSSSGINPAYDGNDAVLLPKQNFNFEGKVENEELQLRFAAKQGEKFSRSNTNFYSFGITPPAAPAGGVVTSTAESPESARTAGDVRAAKPVELKNLGKVIESNTRHDEAAKLKENLSSMTGKRFAPTQLAVEVDTKDKREVWFDSNIRPVNVNGQLDVKLGTIQLDQGVAIAQATPDDGPKEQAARAAGNAATAGVPIMTQQVQVESSRKVIRSGNIEFEVDSFDSALMTVTKLAIEDGGFIASTDSAKLPNGKTRGAVSVRVPPDRLDAFVLKLRGLGDLKTQKISSQDVSKAYTDIESGLRAARAMESRLLEMISKGQGAIKDLLAAEKELGTWREKIEQMEGEKRYYDNLISLSTLVITLQERDIKAAAGAIETERVSAGLETDDVEKSRAEIIKAIDEAGGRIITSDLKKLDAGQFASTITAEVAADKSGPIVDRMKQLGKVARLDVDRRQTNVDGSAAPAPGAHIEKKPSLLTISIYNLANVAPRLTTSVTIAANDVETSYRDLITAVEKAGGRAVSSQLQRPKSDQVTASLQLECPAAKAPEVQAAAKAVGETMNMSLSENPDTANVTTAKVGFSVQIISAASVAPRETSTLQIAAADVATAHKALAGFATKQNARVLQSNLTEGDRDNINATISIELPRESLADWDKSLAGAGDVLTRSTNRSNDTQNTIDSKVRIDLTIFAADRLPPRETTGATINVSGADKSQTSFAALAQELGGRVIDQSVNRDPNGRNSARIVIDVPREKAGRVIGDIRSAGEIWSLNTSSNPAAPDGALSRARFDLTFAEGEALVGREAGVWQSIKDGLSTSLRGLAWSLQLIVVGVCLVAPWVLVLWGAWKLVRRRKAAIEKPPVPVI